MTLTMISKWWYFFHDEWMRRGEDYLRKIVGGWHWRKLRISPEFIWDHERRYHHQNHCHHLHHHRCHSLTVKGTFICCAVTPSLSYCHLCHHYSSQDNCIFYCHYNLWNSVYIILRHHSLEWFEASKSLSEGIIQSLFLPMHFSHHHRRLLPPCVWLKGGEFRVNYWEAERGDNVLGGSEKGGIWLMRGS